MTATTEAGVADGLASATLRICGASTRALGAASGDTVAVTARGGALEGPETPAGADGPAEGSDPGLPVGGTG
jgi:hypothetical protein